MLTRKVEAKGPRLTNTGFLKYGPVLVESIKSRIKGFKRGVGEDRTPNDVSDVEVGRECANHVGRDVAFNC